MFFQDTHAVSANLKKIYDIIIKICKCALSTHVSYNFFVDGFYTGVW